MIRNIDLKCRACPYEQENVICGEDAIFQCPKCHALMEQIWWKRPRGPAQWDDKTAVMVLVNNDPNCPDDVRVRYVGSHEARVPAGYERVYLRSLREVDSFERAHGVANERMHFDRNGRGLDDYYRNEKMTH